MDLFRSVADRLIERPPLVRPRLLTPFEEQAPDFDTLDEEQEHEPITSVTPAAQLVQADFKPIIDLDPTTVEPRADRVERFLDPMAIADVAVEPTLIEKTVERTLVHESEHAPDQVRTEPVRSLSVLESNQPIEEIVRVETPAQTQPAPLQDEAAIEVHPTPKRSEAEPAPNVPAAVSTVQQHVELTEVTLNAGKEVERQVETRVERHLPQVPSAPSPIEVVVEQDLLNQSVVQHYHSNASKGQGTQFTEAPSSTVIEIQIGRIEVNAAKPTPVPPAAPRPNPSRLSLDEVLRRRGK